MPPTPIEAAKSERTKKKRALTLLEGKVNRFIAENKVKKVEELAMELVSEFEAFEKLTTTVQELMGDNEDQVQEDEVYYLDVEESYTKCLVTVNEWKASLKKDVKVEGSEESSKVKEKQAVFEASMLAALNLPKVELSVFDGNPLKYHAFVASFDELVGGTSTSGGAKLTRLIQYTSGLACDAIESYQVIGGDKGYQLARETLKKKFGDEQVIAQALITALRDGDQVLTVEDMKHLCNQLVAGQTVLTQVGSQNEVESQKFIATIVNRLHIHLRSKWQKEAGKKKRRDGVYPGFRDLVKFVQEETIMCSDPIYGTEGLLNFNRDGKSKATANNSSRQQPVASNRQYQPETRRSNSSPSQQTSFATSRGTIVCKFCNENHRLFACGQFRSLRADQQLKFITDQRICENCLLDNHLVDKCYWDSKCGVNGCNLKHSRFIHSCKVPAVNHAISGEANHSDNVNHVIDPSNVDIVKGHDVPHVSSSFVTSSDAICIPMVKVKVNNRFDCHALLDTCSTATFCTRKLADELKIHGVPVDYTLRTLSSSTEIKHTDVIPTLFVESRSSGDSVILHNVFVIDSIPASSSRVDISEYEYLSDIDVSTTSDSVDILIGQDNPIALVPLEIKKRKLDEPFGVRTVLGWSVHGNMGSRGDVCGLIRAGQVSHRVTTDFIQPSESDTSTSKQLDRIEDKVDKLWMMDHEDYACVERSLSCENDKVLKSREMSPSALKKSRWEEGPEFLWEEDESEVLDEEFEIPGDDVEVKQEVVVNVINVEEHPIMKIVKYFSDWRKVKRAVAWLMKIKKGLKTKKKEENKKLTVEEIKQAEEEIIKHVQSQVYHEEIKKLKAGEVVKKSSDVRSLMPILDERGIVCVGGRLKNMKNDEEWKQPTKNPILLPSDHEVAKLIVKEYHEIAHQGREWTLSLLRYKFWITKPRSIIKKVRKECRVCRRLFNKPVNQKMADLPEERAEVVKPFTYVGIDVFGPFYVQQGRHQVKRWGCVYTCLNIRAVHMEKLDSLDTDSFINSFRRFMARRGTPVKVWSDNGTNFVGGSPELIKCMKELDEERLRRFGLEKEVEWCFNPPHASHMGGVWERQIRTIRRILSSLLLQHSDKLSSEVLETFLCEVESIINSRPLTKLSEDVEDANTLSPNQMLMLNEAMGDFPGKFHNNDKYRQRWKFIQHLANQFWKRWLREYLPELQRRSKWNKEEENIKVGDVVLLAEEVTPRYLWPLGLVVEVREGRDGLVRSVKVKTKSTVLVRPVSKVVKLEG